MRGCIAPRNAASHSTIGLQERSKARKKEGRKEGRKGRKEEKRVSQSVTNPEMEELHVSSVAFTNFPNLNAVLDFRLIRHVELEGPNSPTSR